MPATQFRASSSEISRLPKGIVDAAHTLLTRYGVGNRFTQLGHFDAPGITGNEHATGSGCRPLTHKADFLALAAIRAAFAFAVPDFGKGFAHALIGN